MGTMHENVIYTSIKSLCDAHTPPISFSKMCVDLGLSKSLGTKLKDDPDKRINSETAQLIADYFKVSVDRILGNEQKETPTVSGERDMEDLALLAKYREADDSTRAAIRLLLKF